MLNQDFTVARNAGSGDKEQSLYRILVLYIKTRVESYYSTSIYTLTVHGDLEYFTHSRTHGLSRGFLLLPLQPLDVSVDILKQFFESLEDHLQIPKLRRPWGSPQEPVRLFERSVIVPCKLEV